MFSWDFTFMFSDIITTSSSLVSGCSISLVSWSLTYDAYNVGKLGIYYDEEFATYNIGESGTFYWIDGIGVCEDSSRSTIISVSSRACLINTCGLSGFINPGIYTGTPYGKDTGFIMAAYSAKVCFILD